MKKLFGNSGNETVEKQFVRIRISFETTDCLVIVVYTDIL